MQGIENGAGFRQQRIVVGQPPACAGEHGLEAAGFGHEAFAHVERPHHRAEPFPGRVPVQAESGGQHFEGDPRSDMRELGAVEIETDRVRGTVAGRLQSQEARSASSRHCASRAGKHGSR